MERYNRQVYQRNVNTRWLKKFLNKEQRSNRLQTESIRQYNLNISSPQYIIYMLFIFEIHTHKLEV